LKLVAFFTLVFGIVAMAFPMPDDPYHKPVYHAAPDHLGRVKIQVYRGPSENKGGYDSFAPWGFYVTQPKR
jgi:hypothetical protein